MKREKMTKAQIIDNIREKIDVPRKDIHTILDYFFTEMKTAVLSEKIIELRGFGTFEMKTRKGRARARNPRTGEIVPVEDHGVVVFRPGKELKERAWPLRK